MTSGSLLDTDSGTLTLSAGSLVFDLDGAASGDTILAVTGNLKIDTSTTITLENEVGSLNSLEKKNPSFSRQTLPPIAL